MTKTEAPGFWEARKAAVIWALVQKCSGGTESPIRESFSESAFGDLPEPFVRNRNFFRSRCSQSINSGTDGSSRFPW